MHVREARLECLRIPHAPPTPLPASPSLSLSNLLPLRQQEIYASEQLYTYIHVFSISHPFTFTEALLRLVSAHTKLVLKMDDSSHDRVAALAELLRVKLLLPSGRALDVSTLSDKQVHWLQEVITQAAPPESGMRYVLYSTGNCLADTKKTLHDYGVCDGSVLTVVSIAEVMEIELCMLSGGLRY